MFWLYVRQKWLEDLFDAFAFMAELSFIYHDCPSTIIRLSCWSFFFNSTVEKLVRAIT